MIHLTHRNPSPRLCPEFTLEMYALVEAFAKEEGHPPEQYGTFQGASSAIVLACDVLVERGTPSWDTCDAEVVRTMFSVLPGRELHGAMAQAVLDFRRWLHRTGRASADGIAGLEQIVQELPPPPRANRAERRWQARVARRAARH